MKKYPKGFTLLETATVIAIVAIIATVSNFGFRDADRTIVLKSAEEQFITDFERMRSNAINGVFPDANTEPLSYGIYIDFNKPNEYWTFIDFNPDGGDYDKSLSEGDIINIIKLPDGIEISSLNYNKPNIAFELFSGDFYYRGSPATETIYYILTDTKSGNKQAITVNQDGLIVPGAACSDGKVQPGEECDDGNSASNDYCSFDCKNEWCGDGILQDQIRPRNMSLNYLGASTLLEQCDYNDSSPNWNTTNQICNTHCQIRPKSTGNGGCMITPYTPSATPGAGSTTQNQFFLFLLLPLPFIFKLWVKRMVKSEIDK